jgi:hypothetical protein
MTDSNKAFLESIYPYWVQYRDAGILKDPSVLNFNRMGDIYREEFDPRYFGCMHCPEDMKWLFQQIMKLYEQQLHSSDIDSLSKRRTRGK